MLENNKIHQGDVRDLLTLVGENSVDTIITSPPYWSLRFYDIPPTIWDGDPNCEHEWKTYEQKVEMYNNDKRAHWQNKGVSRKTNPKAWQKIALGHGFCTKCGAWKGYLGLEPDFNLYVKHLCDIFDLVKRPLKKTGTLWVNLGDTHYTKSGSGFHFDRVRGNPEGTTNIHLANEIRGLGLLPSKCLVLAPFRFAIEMCNRGWILRNVIIWKKNNVIPSSASDRFTVDFEYIFFFSQNRKYYFERQLEPYATPKSGRYRPNSYPEKSISKEDVKYFGKDTFDGGQGIHDGKRKRQDFFQHEGRNKRTVWEINTKPSKEAHFAVFPPELPELCIKAGCPPEGTVMDIFAGSGTTLRVAKKLGRDYIGLELSEKYCKIAEKLMYEKIEWAEEEAEEMGEIMLL
jgi:site-specific DNA-methyltransferase (adenine-specific)